MRPQAQNLRVVPDRDLHIVAARLKHKYKPAAEGMQASSQIGK